MAAFSTLYRQIRLGAKAVPETTMDYAIRLAAEEFCRKSWYLRETIEFDQEFDTQFYDLETSTPAETKILGVVAVQKGENDPLRPTSQESISQYNAQTDAYIFLPPSTLELIQFVPTGGDAEDLETVLVRVALTVTEECTVIPDTLVQQYRQHLAYGALSYICDMPGETWTNDKTAADSRTLFYEGVFHAKSNAIFSHKPNGNVIALRRFAV